VAVPLSVQSVASFPLVVAGALGACALEAKNPGWRDTATFLGQRFPAQVAGLRFTGARDDVSQSPGQDYWARYERGPRQWTDVYVYDLRRRDIPDQYDEKASFTELESIRRDIAKVVQMDTYRSATPTSSFAIPVHRVPHLNCDRFFTVAPDGEQRDSIASVTNRAGKILEIGFDSAKVLSDRNRSTPS
jgi:hypothetical protein